jgi:hypothetical protein
MDVSGLLHTLFVELGEHTGLALENHLYGCLSLWEQWAEGALEIVEGIVQQDEEPPLNLQTPADWQSVGQAFGFLDTAPPYTGSEAYRAAWQSVFSNPVEWRSLGRVDAVEGPFFERLEALGAIYMQAAMPTGELPASMNEIRTDEPVENEKMHESMDAGAGTGAGTEEKAVVISSGGGRHRYKRTRRTHGRRSLTPVHHRGRLFGITRRRRV